MQRNPRRSTWRVPVLTAAVLALGAAGAGAQTPSAPFRFALDTVASLAWYQVNPHTSLLWATT